MSISELRTTLKKSPSVLFLWNEYKYIRARKNAERESDYDAIVRLYRNSTGRELDLAEPKRFTEKLQWLKLFYRDDCIQRCTDKFTAREYVAELGHADILNELVAVYDSVEEIDFSALPEKFVLKLSHGSGWNIICKDKSKLNWNGYRRVIRSWMKQDLSWYGREWNYAHLTPKIIIERYIDSGDGQLTDYKFFCFNGKVHYIQVDRNRFAGHMQTYFDTSWSLLDFKTGHPNHLEPRPPMFGRMKQLAEEFAKPFPHVRVDFYNIEDRIYFGELTFFDGSGFYQFEPDQWDIHWGGILQLPEPNYNLELYNSLHP